MSHFETQNIVLCMINGCEWVVWLPLINTPNLNSCLSSSITTFFNETISMYAPKYILNDHKDSNLVSTIKSFSHMDRRILVMPLIINGVAKAIMNFGKKLCDNYQHSKNDSHVWLQSYYTSVYLILKKMTKSPTLTSPHASSQERRVHTPSYQSWNKEI